MTITKNQTRCGFHGTVEHSSLSTYFSTNCIYYREKPLSSETKVRELEEGNNSFQLCYLIKTASSN